jgi:hypothetical protein
MKDSGVHDDLR